MLKSRLYLWRWHLFLKQSSPPRCSVKGLLLSLYLSADLFEHWGVWNALRFMGVLQLQSCAKICGGLNGPWSTFVWSMKYEVWSVELFCCPPRSASGPLLSPFLFAGMISQEGSGWGGEWRARVGWGETGIRSVWGRRYVCAYVRLACFKGRFEFAVCCVQQLAWNAIVDFSIHNWWKRRVQCFTVCDILELLLM